MEYQIFLMDEDGFDICEPDVATSLKEAKKIAGRLLRQQDHYPGAYKVEIRGASGECLWDKFF